MIYKRRIHFYETDAQGIVHHSNYLRLFEEARGEFLRNIGVPYSKLREEGYEVVLLEAYCQFREPILYDQEVNVEINLTEMNRYFFHFSYQVWVEGRLKAAGKTKHCFTREAKIVSIPQKLRDLLACKTNEKN
ncbi:thioesterase family protein [Thermocrinis sp.]|uniref:acyl-CoA thioesterase n=1 Tax=Thermocrinis sp. TaxID=2024383 RepID=UPI002FDCDE27